MSVSGNQIKAARALAGMDQKALADAAGVGINTIRNFEGAGQAIVRGRIDTLEAIRSALFTAGVECLMTARPPQAVRGCACAGNRAHVG